MRRSIWIPLLGVAVALVVIFFIFFASRPGDAPVVGDVATGNGVEQNADGTVTTTGEATAPASQTDGDQTNDPGIAGEGESGEGAAGGGESGEGASGGSQ